MSRDPRAVAVVGAAVCVLAGCGVRPTGVVSAGEAPTATATSLPRAQVYFLLRGMPDPVERAVPPWDTQAVFDALLAGPTAQERERGLHTELTADMTIRAIGPGAVFVESPRPASKRTVLEYMQISCTARRLPGAPLVKMPGVINGKFLFALNQRDGMCSGATPSGAGYPSPAESLPAVPTGSSPAEWPTVLPPAKAPKRPLAPSPSG